MYEVKLYDGADDSTGTIIHSHRVNTLKIEGSIKNGINLIDSFDFSFYPDNIGYTMSKPFKTLVTVKNKLTNEYEFEGRILMPTEEMSTSGMVQKSFICEGELGYLHDAPQQHLEFRGTPTALITVILDYYNLQVEPYKHFEVGTITATNSTDNLYVYLSAEKTTFEEIMDKIVNKLGAELQIRKVNGIRYLDILKRVGEDTTTEIKLAKNLMSISKEVDPQEIITRLTPLGTRVKSEVEGATDASEARLTIESVNGGKAYIDREDLIAEFGIQGNSNTWDDVTLPERLLQSGIDFLNKQKVVLNQYKLSALDLSLIGLDTDSLKTGNGYPVRNPIMAIDEILRVIGKTTDINNPEVSSVTVGDKFKTLSEYQQESNMQVSRVKELQATVDGQSLSIKTLRNSNTEITASYNAMQVSYNKLVTTLEIDSDTGTSIALANLKIAIDNLGDDIVSYGVVTTSSDGLMIAADKIKLDDLEEYTEATQSKSGLFSASDKTKLDLVTVSSPVDLNDIVTRLIALEPTE